MDELTKSWPLLVYEGVVVGIVVWLIKRMAQRAGKFPLGQDVVLMRRAGEGLERQCGALMESMLFQIAWLMCVPVVAAGLPLAFNKWSSGVWRLGLVVASLCVGLAVLIWGIRRLTVTMEKVRNLRLGLFGERAVADQLEVLRGKGYSIFHDVPCQGAGGKFNLDHVVVGQGGLAVVETKTYRKPKEGDAKANARVEYDGKELLWPKRRSTEEMEQVERNALWLEQFLKKELGVGVTARRVLVFPGWFVVTTRPGPVTVLNHKQLPGALASIMPGPLPAREQELIIRRLTTLCSDVTFAAVT